MLRCGRSHAMMPHCHSDAILRNVTLSPDSFQVLRILCLMLMQSVRFAAKNIIYRTMASADVLSRLRQNAVDADRIVSELKTQLQSLQQAAAAKACLVESDRLVKENASLRGELERLKQELATEETKHGIRQIPLPNRKISPATANAAPAPAVSVPKAAAAAETKKPAKANAAAASTDGKQNVTPAKSAKEAQQKPAKTEKKSGATATNEPPAAGGETVDVSRLNMRIGRIVEVKKHPDADSLYVEEVDVGEEKHRTIVSGLVKHVPLEQMQNRIAVFLLNLKPAKMRGVMSEGMIMCASSPEKVEIIVPPEGVVIGDRVTVEGYPGAPDDQLNPKKKTWEQIQPDLRINSSGLATYKGALWKVEGKAGNFKAPTMVESAIK